VYYHEQQGGNTRKKVKELTNSTIAHIINSYKRHAKGRNLIWNLNKKQVKELILQNCTYCGNPPTNISCAFAKSDNRYQSAFLLSSGIDRIDNNTGYEVKNVCSCCKICNRAKLNMSHEEFMVWLKQIGAKYGN
jgi:5-methylcytosine-specific restriction endonuclease McrA